MALETNASGPRVSVSASPTSGVPTPTAPAPTNAADTALPGQVDVDQITVAATRFLAGWLLHGTPAQRRAVLEPVTTGDQLDLFTDIPPDALPAGTPTPPRLVTVTPYEATMTEQLSDGTLLALRLVPAGKGWRVATLDSTRPVRGTTL